MIEGLKVTIGGTELADLCGKRAAHHRKRAKVYAEQAANLTAAQIEGMTYSNGDPRRALNDQQHEHEASAAEMEFIENHIVLNEQYLLDRDALYKLGITKSSYAAF
jgi:hypothetical protein